MASYVFLTRGDETADACDPLVVRDGFHWLAFLFPLPWLLLNRLWLPAIGLVAVGALLAILLPGAVMVPATLAVNLIVGFEAAAARINRLQKKGFSLTAAIAADDRDMAEELYFATRDPAETPEGTRAETTANGPSAPPAGDTLKRRWSHAAIGLVELKGRR